MELMVGSHDKGAATTAATASSIAEVVTMVVVIMFESEIVSGISGMIMSAIIGFASSMSSAKALNKVNTF